MTRLDQALIKVYTDRGDALPVPPGSLRPVSLGDRPDDRPEEQTLDRSAAVPVDDVLDSLPETASRTGDLLPLQPTACAPQGAEGGSARPAMGGVRGYHTPPARGGTSPMPHRWEAEITTPWPVRVESPAAQRGAAESAAAEEPAQAGSVHRLDLGTPCEDTAWRADAQLVRPPHMQLARVGVQQGANVAADTGAPQKECVSDPVGDQTFQPMLQVDRFTWPTVCCRLGEAAANELDRLADRLVEAMTRGENVVAIGGCRRGEGATTALLCAGRRLAERGVHLVMADADLVDPQVASRLGLEPEAGWEDVLVGRLPLEEVVVESADDRLAVLPLRQTCTDIGGATGEAARLVESLQTLADHYDLVLLDPGPLEELGVVGASLARAIGSRLRAIALVHHSGLTPPDDLDEVRHWLAATEIVQLGVVENFVRD
jgi:Mrp family chromosome partitioning ATPase